MATSTATRLPQPQRLRLTLDDGTHTTAHVVIHPLASTTLRVTVLPGLAPLEAWCADAGIDHALVGGFYVRTPGSVDGPDVTGVRHPLGLHAWKEQRVGDPRRHLRRGRPAGPLTP